MKKFFTHLTFCVFLLLFIGTETVAQTYSIYPWTTKFIQLSPGVNRYIDSTYYSMKKWSTTPQDQTKHYRDQGSWDTSPYREFSYSTGSIYGANYLNMRLLFPNGFDSAEVANQKFPLIVVLHGAGEGGWEWTSCSSPNNCNTRFDYPFGKNNTIGGVQPLKTDNNDHQLIFGAKEHLAARNKPTSDTTAFPGFVLFPQIRYNGAWAGTENAKVIKVIEMLVRDMGVDPLRIYIWGLSNGAAGTFDAINTRPDLFAAALPMSGGPGNTYSYSKTAHIPMWLFQGETDTNPAPAGSYQVLNSIRNAGGVPRYTEYEGIGHGTWYKAYNEDDFFSWMLRQNKLNIHPLNGITQFCPENGINTELQLSSGFVAYEWRRNGTTISEANSNILQVTQLGTYEARIKTKFSSEWTSWSDPINITLKEPTTTPAIAASGSTTLGTNLDGATNVTLSGPEGYAVYKWSPGNQTTRTISVGNAGTYSLSVTEAGGCISNPSSIIVTKDAPENVIEDPTFLNAIAVSETRINLFWQDVSDDEAGFEIYRSTDDEDYEFVTKTPANSVYYADKAVAPGTTYYYQVRAVNHLGSSPYLGPESATTLEDTDAPSIPGNLTAIGNYDLESITLNWEPSTDNVGVINYIIYEVGANNVLTQVGTTEDTSFVVSDLIQGSSHTYAVKAVDNSGQTSEASNQTTAVVEFCGLVYDLYHTGIDNGWKFVADLQPEQIMTSGIVDFFDINVRNQFEPFINNSDDNFFGFELQGYINIQYAGVYTFYTTSDDGSFLWINNTAIVIENDGTHGSRERSGTINLPVGVYPIKVRYFENSGQAEKLEVRYQGPVGSGISKQIIPSDVLCSGYSSNTSPVAPTSLAAAAVSVNSIDLDWVDASNDEYGFEIYRSEEEAGSYELIHTTVAGIESYTDTGEDFSGTFYYKVRAIALEGQSGYSNVASATTLEDILPPSIPQNLDTLNVKATSIGLSWTSSTDNVGVVGYDIFDGAVLLGKTDRYGDVSDDDEGSSNVSTLQGQISPLGDASMLLAEEATTFKVGTLLTGLEDNQTYNIRIRARDAAGNLSGFSQALEVTTNDPSPLPIELKEFTARVEKGFVQLEWTTASETDNDFFTIERADNGTDFKQIATPDGAGTSTSEIRYSFIDRHPVAGTMYYRLKQTDFNGDFEYSKIVAVQYSFTYPLSLTVYPNPAYPNYFYLKLEGTSTAEKTQVKVVDMVGRIVFDSEYDSNLLSQGSKIDFNQPLSPGIYLVIVEQAGEVFKSRLLIDK